MRSLKDIIAAASHGMSMPEFAQECGIAKSTLYRLYNGDINRMPTADVIEGIVYASHPGAGVTKEEIVQACREEIERNRLRNEGIILGPKELVKNLSLYITTRLLEKGIPARGIAGGINGGDNMVYRYYDDIGITNDTISYDIGYMLNPGKIDEINIVFDTFIIHSSDNSRSHAQFDRRFYEMIGRAIMNLDSLPKPSWLWMVVGVDDEDYLEKRFYDKLKKTNLEENISIAFISNKEGVLLSEFIISRDKHVPFTLMDYPAVY